MSVSDARSPSLALALLALLLFAGCITLGTPADEETRPVGDASHSSPSQPPQDGANDSSQRSGSPNDTRAPSPENRTSQDRRNGTDASRPRLPSNVTLDAGETVERSPTSATFRWQGSLEELQSASGTGLDVPAGIPLQVNATLEWANGSDLEVRVHNDHVEWYCRDQGTQDEGEATCGVRTLARSTWDEWTISVLRTGSPPADLAEPTSFTVRLTVEVTDPWDGPPFETREETDAASDPGWPSLDEAAIRPAVKVGSTLGGQLNSGTANFVFSSPGNQTLYLGWVAHGVDGLRPGDEIVLAKGQVTGTLVYCSYGAIEETVTCPEIGGLPEERHDFALVRLPAEARHLVHPATLVWGGPTGMAGAPEVGDRVLAVGNTPYRDGGRSGVNAADAQQGVVTTTGPRETETTLAPPGVPGDSGSPAIAESGRAIGTVSDLEIPAWEGNEEGQPQPTGGTTSIANLAYAVDFMEERTALEVELETWPRFETPRAGDLAGPVPMPARQLST